MIYIILAIVALVIAVGCYALKNEKKIVEKAEKTNNMFNFYHVLATLTSSKYKNYKENEAEIDAMAKYLTDNSNKEHENHPIGSYFKLCDENNDVCHTAGNFDNSAQDYDPTQLSIGAAVLVGFIVIILVVAL